MKEYFVAAGPNELENSENEDGKIAGFWQGLWHGSIAPFSLVISLFKEDIGIYETHNNGHKYNFGFIIGLMIVFGGNRGVSKAAYSRSNDSD
jgi:hypothetical protein